MSDHDGTCCKEKSKDKTSKFENIGITERKQSVLRTWSLKFKIRNYGTLCLITMGRRQKNNKLYLCPYVSKVASIRTGV